MSIERIPEKTRRLLLTAVVVLLVLIIISAWMLLLPKTLSRLNQPKSNETLQEAQQDLTTIIQTSQEALRDIQKTFGKSDNPTTATTTTSTLQLSEQQLIELKNRLEYSSSTTTSTEQ